MPLGTKVAELLVGVGVDLKDFNKGMQGLEKRLQTTGARLQKVGKSMTRGLTLPLLAAGAAAVKVASDAQEMRGKFDVVFPSSGGGIIKKMTEFASVTNQSKHEMIGLTATVGDILKPLGFTEQAAADLSVEMVQLAVDLSSFNNMPMDEALQRLQGTLIGSHENALKFGVVINENVLKQELARIGADKLTGAQREQAKVQARINLLMAGTSDAQGDAERTAGSFANTVRGLKNTLKDLGVEIGNGLLPTMTKLVNKAKDSVEWFSELSGTEKAVVGWAAAVLAAMGPLVIMTGMLVANLTVLAPYLAGLAAVGAAVALPVTAAVFGARALMNASRRSDPNAKPLSAEDRLKAFRATQGGGLMGNVTDEDRALFPGLFNGGGGGLPAAAGGTDDDDDGTARWAANTQKVEKAALAGLHHFEGMKEPVMVLRQTTQVVSESWEMMRGAILGVNERVRVLGTEMRLGMADTLGDALGQLATLQTGFVGFIESVVQGLRRQLAEMIALIAKQKILNALKAQESMFSSSGGLLGALGAFGMGNPLLGLGLAIGGIALSKAFSNRGGNQQLQATRLPGGDIAISANSGNRRHARLAR